MQALFQTASKQGVSVKTLLNAVLAQLDALLSEYAQNGFASCVGEYDAANRDTNRPVLLLQEGRVVHEGVVKGVDVQGALRLQTDKGEKPSSAARSAYARITARHNLPLRNRNAFAAGRRQQSVEMGVGGERHIFEVGHAPYRDLTQLGEEWLQFADEDVKIVGCAVCGSVKKAMVEEQLTRPVEWLSSMPQALGIRNHYRRPEEHGSDRWFNALGSRRFTQNACVVVSCGTAITTDALTEDNHYLGGTIMPGFHLMKEAMALKTANLNRPIGKVYPFQPQRRTPLPAA